MTQEKSSEDTKNQIMAAYEEFLTPFSPFFPTFAFC
jgi:hypothetical protein